MLFQVFFFSLPLSKQMLWDAVLEVCSAEEGAFVSVTIQQEPLNVIVT